MKKNFGAAILIFFSFVFLILAILFFRPFLIEALDSFFLFLFGKSLAARSTTAQLLFLLPFFLALYGILFWFGKRFFPDESFEKRHGAKTALFLPFVVSFLLFAILAMTTIIRRDDYWEIHDSLALGFKNFIIAEYSGATGRYTSLMMKALYNVIDPLLWTRIGLILVCIIQYAGLYHFSRFFLLNLCEGRGSRLSAGILAGIGTTAFYFLSPSIWEFWFWASGTFVYGLGAALITLSFSLLLRGTCCRPYRKRFVLPGMVCCVFACGCSELTTLSLCAFSFCAIFFDRFCRPTRRWNPCLIAFFALTIFCARFSLFSPGSTNSASILVAANQNKTSLLTSIFSLMGTAVRFAVHDVIGYTYSRTEYILIFLAQLFLFGLFLKIPKQRVKPMLIMTGLFLLVAIGCLFVNGIIGYTPARVLTIPVIWVFLAFAIPVLLAASAVGQFVSSNLRGRAFLMLSVTSMLVWGWFFCGNISALQENRAAWLVRNDTLEKSRGQRGIVDTCGIPVLGSVMPDLIAEPDYEFNRVTALYYDIEFLRAETLCIE